MSRDCIASEFCQRDQQRRVSFSRRRPRTRIAACRESGMGILPMLMVRRTARPRRPCHDLFNRRVGVVPSPFAVRCGYTGENSEQKEPDHDDTHEAAGEASRFPIRSADLDSDRASGRSGNRSRGAGDAEGGLACGSERRSSARSNAARHYVGRCDRVVSGGWCRRWSGPFAGATRGRFRLAPPVRFTADGLGAATATSGALQTGGGGATIVASFPASRRGSECF